MRTNEERIISMHDRARELNKQLRARRVKVIQSAGAIASFAAVIVLALFMPDTASFSTDSAVTAPGEMNASIFAGSEVLGYIVIAIIAFLLGMSVTVFCFRLKRWQREKDAEDIL